MNLFTIHFYSDSLKGAAAVNVLLPAASPEALAEGGFHKIYAGRREYPCLWLLHGMQGDEGSWLRFSRAEQYAAEHSLAVALPSMGNSFGLDLPFHQHYDDFLCEELPSFLRHFLPLSEDPAQNFIAGLSMGGFAALHIALRHPDRYGGAASFSGALDPHALSARRGESAGGAALVPPGLLAGLAAQASRASASLPPLYLTCGLQDEITLDMNREMSLALKELGLPVAYEEWEGGHEWGFWDESLRRALLRFLPE